MGFYLCSNTKDKEEIKIIYSFYRFELKFNVRNYSRATHSQYYKYFATHALFTLFKSALYIQILKMAAIPSTCELGMPVPIQGSNL